MAMPDLAEAADLATYGYPPEAQSFLARASARVRRHTRQKITEGTSTVTLHAWPYRLPQRPVTAIVSVTSDGVSVPYRLDAAGVIEVYGTCARRVVVEYEHGYDIVPDGLVELVCSIAARMAATPDAVGAGAQTEQAGGESITWGYDAYAGTTGLTQAERRELDRMFPRLPSTTFLRP